MSRLTWQAAMSASLGEFVEPATVEAFGYEATVAGIAGTAEPNWPLVAGATVVDGTITWTARTAMTITWTARPLYETGAVEPVWPTAIGGTVVDGTVTWTAETPAIQDAKCPKSRIAKVMASKVFSPYKDVLRYSATVNPRDWSSPDDAGFLPTGDKMPEAPEVTALGEYRGRMAVFTAGGLQIWTVDPDPAEMSLFDTHPGIGTNYAHANISVAGDHYFASHEGIRSLSVAAGANTLDSNDIGANIDPIMRPLLAGGAYDPVAYNAPGLAQARWVFGNVVYALSRSRLGKIAAWSHFVYPDEIEATTQLAGRLYHRIGDVLYVEDRESAKDYGIPFPGRVEWPHLDLGSPGVTKMLHGVDVVGYGACSVSVGWDQTNPGYFTDPYPISEDTLVDGIVPIAIGAPSIALRIDYAGGTPWQLNAANLYLQDSAAPK